MSPRLGAGTRRQLENAFLAASTAAPTSATPERGKRPIKSCRLAGLRFSNVAPLPALRHFPPIKFCARCDIAFLRYFYVFLTTPAALFVVDRTPVFYCRRD